MSGIVKLVISDADGTLLHLGKQIDARTFDRMLDTTRHRGIPFAVASGRTYGELCTIFAKQADRLLFIPLDGALAIAGNELLCGFPMTLSAVAEVLELLPRTDVRGIAFCTQNAVYLYAKEEALLRTETARLGEGLHILMKKSGSEVGVLPDEPIYKIVVYKKRGAYHAPADPIRIPAGLRAVYDTDAHLELVRADVSKRRAAEVLTDALHIAPADMLVYGDGENDCELLTFVREAGGRAVTIYGAKHDLFSITPYHTKNVADSVLRFLSDDDRKAEDEQKEQRRKERIMKYSHG